MKRRARRFAVAGLLCVLVAVASNWPSLSFAVHPFCSNCLEIGDCEEWNCPTQSASEARHDFSAGLPKGVRNLVDHAATPVRVFSKDQSLEYYCVGNEGSQSVLSVNPSAFGRFVAHLLKNRQDDAPESIVLYRGVHPGTNQEIVINYITDAKVVRMSTSYADGKPYEFDIDDELEVIHLRW